MRDNLSSYAPNVKDNVSRANPSAVGKNRLMATSNAELTFNQELCARVRALRDAKDWSQEQMAIALGVPVERYRKYETRSPLPSYLMERFALITDCTVEHLLTGKSTPKPAINGQKLRA